MKLKSLNLLGLSFFVFFSMQCSTIKAEEVRIEKIIVTSTMTPKEIEKAPGSIQVINAIDIKNMGAETAAEALADATGIDLDKVAGRGTIAQIRGLSNKRTLILIDGMRFSTGFRDTTVDLSEFPAELIKRIEIVRGPTSSLYGSEAMGGVINIITKDAPADTQASCGTSYGTNAYGDGSRWNAKATMGGSIKNLGVIVSAHSDIVDKFDRNKEDSFTDIDDEEKYGGMLKLDYTPSESHKVSGGVFMTDTVRQGLRSKYTLDWDRDADSSRFSSFLQYDGTMADTAIMLRSYYSLFNLDRSYIDIGEPYPANLQKKAKAQPDREDFDIDNSLWQYEIRASRLIASTHMVTMGGEYREEKRKGVENRGEVSIDKTIDNAALLFQDDFMPIDNLQCTLGLRFDDHSDFGTEISPRVSLVYSIYENLRLKASYGEGFRAPSVYELYVDTENNKGDVLSNENLNPESAKSFDFGLEGEWGILSSKLTFFRNDIENMIYKQATGNFRNQGKNKIYEYEMVNIEDAFTQGVETEIELKLSKNFKLTGTSTYLDSENNETNEELLEVPEWKNSLKFSYDSTPRDFHINLRMNHTGEQLYAPKFEDSVGQKKSSYTLFHIYSSKKISRNMEVYAGINNIFNKKPDYDDAEVAYYYCGLNLKF